MLWSRLNAHLFSDDDIQADAARCVELRGHSAAAPNPAAGRAHFTGIGSARRGRLIQLRSDTDGGKEMTQQERYGFHCLSMVDCRAVPTNIQVRHVSPA